MKGWPAWKKQAAGLEPILSDYQQLLADHESLVSTLAHALNIEISMDMPTEPELVKMVQTEHQHLTEMFEWAKQGDDIIKRLVTERNELRLQSQVVSDQRDKLQRVVDGRTVTIDRDITLLPTAEYEAIQATTTDLQTRLDDANLVTRLAIEDTNTLKDEIRVLQTALSDYHRDAMGTNIVWFNEAKSLAAKLKAAETEKAAVGAEVVALANTVEQLAKVRRPSEEVEANLITANTLIQRAKDAIEWLREYASGFEILQLGRSGQHPSPEIAAKGEELTALDAELNAFLNKGER